MDAYRLSPDDAAEVAALFARSRAAGLPWLPVLHTPEEDVAYFAGQLRDGVGLGVAADGVGPGLRGFAVVRPGWLDHLYVDADCRGGGIGSALLDAARSASPGELHLWVFARNTRALAFYARHGAVEVERTDGRDNEEHEPDVRLVLPAR